MSVIIRLQNLPWSANATDIRAYFSGLSIPEGGVHIVGGEQGDAFIAFSTDEDARQAMLRDEGKLKEVKIKLFLSSRTEMLRIIEQARQQTLNIQSIMQGTVAPPVSAPVMPTPSANSYESVESKDKEEEDDKGRDDDESHRDRRDRRERDRSGSRDRGRSKDRSRDRDRERGRHRGGGDNRGGGESRGGDRERDRRRRERSKSRDRYRRRSRSRDRRRSRDKDQPQQMQQQQPLLQQPMRNRRRDSTDSDEKGDPKDILQQQQVHHQLQHQHPLHPKMQHQQLQQHPLQQHAPVLQQNMIQSSIWEPTVTTKQALLPDPVLPQLLLQQMQHQRKEVAPPQQQPSPQHQQHSMMPFQDQDRRPFGGPSQYPVGPRGREPWQNPAMDPRLRHPVPSQNYPMSQYPLMNQPQYHTSGPPPSMKDPIEMPNKSWNNSSNPDEKDVCIEIHGLPLNATYVDVKRLFDGLSIPPDGIKMINDNHGNRTGIAYVKFTNPAHKRLALNQNGKKVRSSIVEVLHLRESIYKTAVDNFKPEKDVTLKSEDMDIDNGDIIEDNVWKRESESKKSNFQDPRVANKNSVGNKNQVKTDSPRKEKPKHECVLIKGLPVHTSERDILDFFSELGIAPIQISFAFDQIGQPVGDAFCQFETAEEAEKASSKDKTNMGRNILSVFCVPHDEMERQKHYLSEPYMPHYRQPYMPMRGGQHGYQPRMPNDGMMGGGGGDRHYMDGDRPRYGNDRYMGDNMGERMPMMGRGRGRGMMQGRPPRRPRNNNRASSPYIDGDSLEKFGQPGCVVALENIHFKADIEEIMDFFDGFDVEHESVIRRFDDNGRATGDARVAMKSPPEASRAVRQLMFKTIRGRPIKLSIVQ